MEIIKPKEPFMSAKGQGVYNITSADQVKKADGTPLEIRGGGKCRFVRRTFA